MQLLISCNHWQSLLRSSFSVFIKSVSNNKISPLKEEEINQFKRQALFPESSLVQSLILTFKA